MRRLDAVLYVVALALACVCVVGGVLVWQEKDSRAEASSTQLGYGAVQQSATKEAEAMINVDYRDAQASIDKVAAGATGAFKKQYDSSTKGVIEILTRNKSVMTGDVEWAGVSNLDGDSATVLVATSGTVSNVSTNNKPVARSFRMKLDLVRVDGDWLTENLEFLD